MISPGVTVMELPREPTSKFLRASEILELACRETVPGRPMDALTRASFQSSLRGAIARQLELRGLSGGENASVVQIEVVEEGDSYVVMAPDGWVKHVDFILGNRDCQRCGGLIVFRRPHSVEDCNLVLVRDVIES